MKRRWMPFLLPAAAILGLLMGLYMVVLSRKHPPTPPIPFPPAVSPYEHFVAGEGQIEAPTQNILIGSPITALIEKIYVLPGDEVEAGDPLFTLDIRDLVAQREQAIANYEAATAEYEKQLDLPRPEDIPPLEAIQGQAEANYQDRLRQFELYEKVRNPQAISVDEFNKRKYAAESAKYTLEEAQARLALLKAGAWIRDLNIFRAKKKEAEKQIEVIQTNIERSTIRAPVKGQIFRLNIRVGELVTTTQPTENDPLIIMGSLSPLHMRVDIDEADSWRVLPNSPGVAFVRGNSTICIPLEFVRIDPYMVPKQNLTGLNTQHVDTRVLQVIYQFNKEDLPVYPGQLMDVFLEARPNLKPWKSQNAN